MKAAIWKRRLRRKGARHDSHQTSCHSVYRVDGAVYGGASGNRVLLCLYRLHHRPVHSGEHRSDPELYAHLHQIHMAGSDLDPGVSHHRLPGGLLHRAVSSQPAASAVSAGDAAHVHQFPAAHHGLGIPSGRHRHHQPLYSGNGNETSSADPQ